MISKVNKNIFIWVFLLAILAVNSFAVSVWNNSMSTSTGWTTTTGSPSFTTFDSRNVLRMGVGDEGYFLTTSNFTSGENFSITTVNYLTGTDMEQSALAMLDASRVDSSSENGYICDVYEDSGTRYARLTRCASGTCSWGGMDNTNTANFPEGTWFKLILKKRGGQLNCLATSNDGSTVYFNLSGVDGSPLTGMDYLNILNGDTGNDYVYDHEIDIDDLTETSIPTDNLTITITSDYSGNAINNVSANISLDNGSSYYLSNVTGNIISTTIPQNESFIGNITVESAEWFNNTYSNYNISNDLAAKLNQTYINISAYELLTNKSITGCNWTIGAITYGCSDNIGIDNGLYNATFTHPNYFSGINEFNVNQNKTYLSYGFYNFGNAIVNITVYNITQGANVNNFTARIDGLNYTYTDTQSTTDGYIEFNVINGSWNITLDDPNFALTTSQINVTPNQVYNYTINAYTTNSINFSFYDTHTLTQLIGTNVTFEIIGDEFANNYTTDDGYLYIDLIVPFNYTLRYSAPNYYESTSAFNLVNRSTNAKTLYLINSSKYANITVTVIDEIGSKLESARVTSQRYDISTNTYRSEEVISTNFEGIGVIHAELNGELYKFLIEYPAGTLRDTTSPSVIFSNTLTLQIRISEEVLSEFDDYQGVDHNLTFNNVTNNFRFVYSDPNGVLNQACLELYTINQFSNTLLNTSCLNTVSGTILLNVTPANGTTYQAKAYIDVDSDLNLVASKIVSFGKSVLETPNWMFWNALVTGVFALLLFVVPEIGLCVIMFPTIGFSFIGLIPVHVSIPISVQLVFIVLAFAIAKKRGTL